MLLISLNNADINRYSYSGYGISFDARGVFSLSNGNNKNVIIFVAGMSLPLHVDNNKNISKFSVKCQRLGLDDAILTAEAEYSINFIKQGKKFCLSLHYNESNNYLFANVLKIYQFKAKLNKIDMRMTSPLII